MGPSPLDFDPVPILHKSLRRTKEDFILNGKAFLDFREKA